MLSRPSRVLMRRQVVDWPRKHGTPLSPDPICTPPCPLDTGTVDEMDGVSCYARNSFVNPIHCSSPLDSGCPLDSGFSPTVGRPYSAAMCWSLDPASGLTGRSPTLRRFHFREGVSLAKYSTASRKALSIMALRSPSTLPTVLRSWQSGKEVSPQITRRR